MGSSALDLGSAGGLVRMAFGCVDGWWRGLLVVVCVPRCCGGGFCGFISVWRGCGIVSCGLWIWS